MYGAPQVSEFESIYILVVFIWIRIGLSVFCVSFLLRLHAGLREVTSYNMLPSKGILKKNCSFDIKSIQLPTTLGGRNRFLLIVFHFGLVSRAGYCQKLMVGSFCQGFSRRTPQHMIVYLNQVVGPSALMELQNPFLSKLAVIVGSCLQNVPLRMAWDPSRWAGRRLKHWKPSRPQSPANTGESFNTYISLINI